MSVKNKSTPVRKKIFTPSNGTGLAGPRFILLGGFLGAGKTTCLKRLVEWVEARQLKVGVVTNDQADRLVDTAVALDGAAADSVRQISGGCFCCKADDLVTKLHELKVAVRPDVLIAEPVGSCTDLMATVILPLQQVYREDFLMAPMSVVVDASRIYAAWFPAKGKEKGGFSEDVEYIFGKQLEEAEIVVLNKVDLLTAGQRTKLRERMLEFMNQEKAVLEVSTATGEGLDEWFSKLMTEQSAPARLMEVDYERYAAGEALMGWYNAALSLHSTGNAIDGNKLLMLLAGEIMEELEGEGVELAHFKMSLKTLDLVVEKKEKKTVAAGAAGGLVGVGGNAAVVGTGNLGVVNAVRNGQKPTLSRRLEGPVVAGEFLVNLRAEGAPEILEAVVGRHLDKTRATVRFVWREKCAFRPGRPVPVHRVTVLEGRV